jgi:hypothetical protein
MDQQTPTVWHELLAGVSFEDAKTAANEVMRTQPFCSPSEILTIVRRIRAQRRRAFGPLTPPPGLSELEERQWMRRTTELVASGQLTPDQLPRPERTQLPEGLFARKRERSG